MNADFGDSLKSFGCLLLMKVSDPFVTDLLLSLEGLEQVGVDREARIAKLTNFERCFILKFA